MIIILFIFLVQYPRQLFHSSWIFGPRVHQFEALTTWGGWSQEYNKSPKKKAVLLALNKRTSKIWGTLTAKKWKISKTRVEDPILEIFHFCKVPSIWKLSFCWWVWFQIQRPNLKNSFHNWILCTYDQCLTENNSQKI